MSGTRFARTGRCRFIVCLVVLISLLCMVAIYHSSQQQLDEAREQRLRCERQQEQLNEQLQNLAEQKYNQQKTLEQERNEQMKIRHSLEQKLKEVSALRSNEQTELRTRYDKLLQEHKLLKSEHYELVTECQKSKKELLESANAMEKKLQSARSEAEKERNVLNSEIALWQGKYNTLAAEKERLEGKSELQINNFEHIIADYQQHCDYKPDNTIIIKKIFNPPNKAQITSPQSRLDKSFKEQVPVSPGLYHIDIKLTNKTQEISAPLTNKTASATNSSNIYTKENSNGRDKQKANENDNLVLKAGSDIVAGNIGVDGILPKPIEKIVESNDGDINYFPQVRQPITNQSIVSAGGSKISPLSSPRKMATTTSSKLEQFNLEASAPIKQINTSSTTSSGMPPLPLPPNVRKLPDNVAPIPANFDELLNEDRNANRNADALKKSDGHAAGVSQKNDNDDDANNNRYANAINDMEPKASHKEPVVLAALANAANEDSGAHEIKDNDFINDPNFNLPADEDKHFFDGGGKNEAAGGNADEKPKNDANDDVEGLPGAVDAGDIAVKNNNLLDTNNLNNEVAGDQGKEFPDELRLEENNEEDEDEDDYSNPAARQQGEQAIRN
ncbi:myb-like protein X isoform X2 [Eurosta solidaginis]|uniref:myb-like protein X isoform X2 n=1 Tax=Eurosta solidaginis TaxID=178769 RepID=UPI0035305775